MTQEDMELFGWLLFGTFAVWMVLMAFLTDEPRHEDETEEEDPAKEINQY